MSTFFASVSKVTEKVTQKVVSLVPFTHGRRKSKNNSSFLSDPPCNFGTPPPDPTRAREGAHTSFSPTLFLAFCRWSWKGLLACSFTKKLQICIEIITALVKLKRKTMLMILRDTRNLMQKCSCFPSPSLMTLAAGGRERSKSNRLPSFLFLRRRAKAAQTSFFIPPPPLLSYSSILTPPALLLFGYHGTEEEEEAREAHAADSPTFISIQPSALPKKCTVRMSKRFVCTCSKYLIFIEAFCNIPSWIHYNRP